MTIECFRQQARGSCFANAACAGEEISVMKPLMLDGVSQRARDGFLACYFVECLRTPFARDYLVGHLVVCLVSSELARPRTFPQHTLPLLPLLRSRPGGVHKASVVRSPGSDKPKSLSFDARTSAIVR